jgi:hypothetical protein
MFLDITSPLGSYARRPKAKQSPNLKTFDVGPLVIPTVTRQPLSECRPMSLQVLIRWRYRILHQGSSQEHTAENSHCDSTGGGCRK